MSKAGSLTLCDRIGTVIDKCMKIICPCLYCLLYSERHKYKVLKIIAGFVYGLILGLVFYEVILVDLDFTPTICMVMGSIICLMLGIGNAISTQIRCISMLTFPSFCGRAGRGVLKALLFAYVIAGPVQNLVVNGREVVRTFACSSSLTYNLTKTRIELMFKPFQEALLNMKADTSEVKDTMRSIKGVVLPIADEIEGEEEMLRMKEDNDYMDAKMNDSKRTEELDTKYKRKQAEKEGQKYEREYKKKLEMRCEDIMSRGTGKCRGMFEKAYDNCYDKVSVFAAWLLCWPMKLTFVCNLIEAMGGQKACDPGDQVDPGFGESYASLKHSDQDLGDEFKQVKVQYKVMTMPPWLDVRDATDTAKSVLNEFQQKRAVLDVFLLIIKRLLAFVFIKIILGAQDYHDKYVRDMEFDNNYITGYFRRIDARRRQRGQTTLLPLKKPERAAFLDPRTICPGKLERGNLGRQTVKLVLEMVTATTFIMMDRLFFETLDLVQRHAHIDYTQTGSHDLTLTVRGSGLIANLVRSVVGGFNVKKRIKATHSNRACLPKPHMLANYYLYKIYGMFLFLWLMLLNDAYTQRLRRVICSYFYPKREKRRVLFLYNETLKRRAGFFKFMKRQVRRRVKEHRLSLDAGMLMVIRLRYSRYCGWLRYFSATRRKCLLCGEVEPRKGPKNGAKGCENPNCHFYTCPECWHDIDEVCYACTKTTESDNDDAEEEVTAY